MNLPPTMTKADVCQHLLDTGGAGLTREERAALMPFVERWADAFYARRGNPRTILTPIVMMACEGAMVMLQTALGG